MMKFMKDLPNFSNQNLSNLKKKNLKKKILIPLKNQVNLMKNLIKIKLIKVKTDPSNSLLILI